MSSDFTNSQLVEMIELAALRHGVAGIHGQVQHDFAPLRGVGEHGPQFGIEIHLQVDLLAEQNSEHIRLLTQHVIQIEPFSPRHLAAFQAQPLPREFLRAAHCLRDQPYLLFRIAFAFLKPLGHGQNHRQQIVEVVSDRSRDSPRQIELSAGSGTRAGCRLRQ